MGHENSRGRWSWWGVLLVGGGLLAGGGCAVPPDARYVYQDGQYGVIGVPRNSPFGRRDYEVQARELMTRHFPGGYEVVRAEEVVAGERTLDKAIKKDLETEPGLNAFNQMLKLGKFARSSSIDEKDVTHITESRIIYRRRPTGPDKGMDGFALIANQGPGLYLDPNELARRVDQEAMLAAHKLDADKDLHKDRPADGKLDDNKAKVAAAQPKDDAIQKAAVAAPVENQ